MVKKSVFLLLIILGYAMGQTLFACFAYGDSLRGNNVRFTVTPGEDQTIYKDHRSSHKSPNNNVSETFQDSEHGGLRTLDVPPLIFPQKYQEAMPAKTQLISTAKVNAKRRVLILFDSPSGVPFKKVGIGYAIMLRNLLGHFKANVDLLAIEDYSVGKIESYDAIFYLGSYFDNPLPKVFFSDIMKTIKTIVWFKYNLWQLVADQSPGFTQKFGFTFNGLRGFNAPPSTSNPQPGFFDTVEYKERSLVKFYQFDEATQTVKADPEVGITQVIDGQKAQVQVVIKNDKTRENAPYILRSGNFWYVADIPFTFIGPRDRYLVMADILHDILDIHHPENHRAMVRLEDVGALVNPESMKKLSDFLHRKDIPFSIATIPFFRDPLGKYSGGISKEIHLSQAENLLKSLRYAARRGGKVVMHGYTHQYDTTLNPLSGVSGEDFEFWDIVANSPVAEDSVEWAHDRIRKGLLEFKYNDFIPIAFGVPHYQASPKSYQAIKESFKSRYERSVYYTSDNPSLNLDYSDPQRDFIAGQFFPYIIYEDYYGQTVLPENLGNIEYATGNSNIDYGWTELYKNAYYGFVVRDGFASFFFHPFLLDPALPVPAFEDFKKLIHGITGLGYQWVGAHQIQ